MSKIDREETELLDLFDKGQLKSVAASLRKQP